MNFKFFLKTNSVFKFLLLVFSTLLWLFFYFSSKFSLKSILVLDLSVVSNIFSFNFLIFLILFPIPSILSIVYSTQKDFLNNLFLIFLSFVVSFFIAFLWFKFSINFLIFIFFYILSHIFVCALVYRKYKEQDKPVSISNYGCSLFSAFFFITILIVVFLIVYPSQEVYSKKMQNGIIDVFIGEDIEPWALVSNTIKNSSTKTVVEHIASSKEYTSLKRLQDPVAYGFVDFIEDLNKDAQENNSTIVQMLDYSEVKNNFLQALNSTPILNIFYKYFAFFMAIMIASFSQFYFYIAFSLLGMFYFLIFHKLFKNEKEGE